MEKTLSLKKVFPPQSGGVKIGGCPNFLTAKVSGQKISRGRKTHRKKEIISRTRWRKAKENRGMQEGEKWETRNAGVKAFHGLRQKTRLACNPKFNTWERHNENQNRKEAVPPPRGGPKKKKKKKKKGKKAGSKPGLPSTALREVKYL